MIAGSRGLILIAPSGAWGAHPFVNFGYSVVGNGGSFGAFLGTGGILEI